VPSVLIPTLPVHKLGICLPHYGRPIEVPRIWRSRSAPRDAVSLRHDDQGKAYVAGSLSLPRKPTKIARATARRGRRRRLGRPGSPARRGRLLLRGRRAWARGPLDAAHVAQASPPHDTTESVGSSYVIHVAHSADAIATKRQVQRALIPRWRGRPRAEGMATGHAPAQATGRGARRSRSSFPFGPTV